MAAQEGHTAGELPALEEDGDEQQTDSASVTATAGFSSSSTPLNGDSNSTAQSAAVHSGHPSHPPPFAGQPPPGVPYYHGPYPPPLQHPNGAPVMGYGPPYSGVAPFPFPAGQAPSPNPYAPYGHFYPQPGVPPVRITSITNSDEAKLEDRFNQSDRFQSANQEVMQNNLPEQLNPDSFVDLDVDVEANSLGPPDLSSIDFTGVVKRSGLKHSYGRACVICTVTFNSIRDEIGHLKGKPHANAMAIWRRSGKVKKTPVFNQAPLLESSESLPNNRNVRSNNGNKQNQQPQQQNGYPKRLEDYVTIKMCRLCSVNYSSQQSKVQHEQGKRHKKALDEFKRAQRWDQRRLEVISIDITADDEVVPAAMEPRAAGPDGRTHGVSKKRPMSEMKCSDSSVHSSLSQTSSPSKRSRYDSRRPQAPRASRDSKGERSAQAAGDHAGGHSRPVGAGSASSSARLAGGVSGSRMSELLKEVDQYYEEYVTVARAAPHSADAYYQRYKKKYEEYMELYNRKHAQLNAQDSDSERRQ